MDEYISELAGRPGIFYSGGKQLSYGQGNDTAVIAQIFYSGGGWGDPNNSLAPQGNTNIGLPGEPNLWAFNFSNYYQAGQGGGMGYSFHTGICNVLMGDGTVRGISQNIDIRTAVALWTRSGGETVGAF